MLCTHKTTILCQFGLFCHQLTTISPPILIHFWWELYHQATYYQSQIGILHWIVELGRVDITTEVSLLASHVALPRKGHLQTVFHIYGYLKKRHNSRLALDPSYPEIDMRVSHQADWADFYGDVKEAIPDNAPEPRGKSIILRAFVDSDHANDKVRWRS